MSKSTNKKVEKIGEGAFGQVIVVNDTTVRKVFDELKHMIQETMMLRYMSGSKYVVEITSFNTSIPSINLSRWPSSLRTLIERRNVSMASKMKIFKCMLKGLSHMHQVGVLHSDFKLSNILVDGEARGTSPAPYEACICDLGLSSLYKYAKIGQTAPKYRPEKLVYSHGHDMYGLCVSMVDFFNGGVPNRLYTAKELRAIIRKMKIDDSIKKILALMCPDDPRNAISVDEVLLVLFKSRTTYITPKAVIHENRMDEETVAFLKATLEEVATSYEVNRGVRCFESIFNFFNSEKGSMILRSYWPIYISAALLIYSSLFGTRQFDSNAALVCTKGKYTKNDLYDALDVLMSDDDFLYMTMV